MLFPESERVAFTKNPLQEVVCQLRYPSILEISTDLPSSFQKRIRKRYPLLSKHIQTPDLGELPPPVAKEIQKFVAGLSGPGKQPIFRFSTEGDTPRVVSLHQDFLALSDQDYLEWRKFKEELKLAEEAFRELYEPAFYTRVGLLYRNIIDREMLGLDDCDWSELLNESFVGLLGAKECNGRFVQNSTESLIEIPNEDGFLRIQHGLGIKQSGQGRSQVYVISSDFYAKGRIEPESVYARLDNYRNIAGNFFRWVIKPELSNALGPKQ